MKNFPSRRPVPEQRTFSSESVEALADRVAAGIADPELAWLFRNCLPNTLDTTIDFRDEDGPDTFVITGDIPAMWLRDSAAQVWPFLPLARADEKLRLMLAGVVRRQAQGILLDPYANAFYRDAVLGHWKDDLTEMRPGVHERKWELDSLAYFVRLSHGYWAATGDRLPFDETWRAAMGAMFALLEIEQGAGGRSRYSFERPGGTVLPCGGRGRPSADCGLIRCAFRPSDDMVAFPFLVPSNAMMAVALRDVVPLLQTLDCGDLAGQAARLSGEIFDALEKHAVVRHPAHGEIWAYEVDGLGGVNLMDDANVPSLLSLPYLGFCDKTDPRYLRTRKFCLSADNPYFASGPAGAGIGSPHTGQGTIWPMALSMQALTATDGAEILRCLDQLAATHAGTGFMHESFQAGDADVFTRPWFSWANTLFGELLVNLGAERPGLLK